MRHHLAGTQSFDVAKKTRVKVEIGDCVSMRANYWGKPFAWKLKEKRNIERLLEQVHSVVNNSNFSVVWDSNQEMNQHTSLGKCNYKPQDTLLQKQTTCRVLNRVPLPIESTKNMC